MSKTGCIDFGGRRITFKVERSERQRLAVTVEPDLTVRVVAPIERTMPEIEFRVRRRAGWIIRQIEDFERFLPRQPPRRYVSGETHLYLGRQYRLKVHRLQELPVVKLKGGYIHVWVRPSSEKAEVRSELLRWYRERAKYVFEQAIEEALEKHRSKGLSCQGLQIRTMTKRWGSYTPSGMILLNLDLIKAPRPCIDYVVLHELCHSVVPHHGNRFESLLTRCMPDWRARKARLERSMP